MKELDKEHDKLFKKTFGDVENSRAFLSIVLPEPLKEAVDLSGLEIDTTNYVSSRFKELFSDIVVKTRIKGNSGYLNANIYIILEHKCYRDTAIFLQLLHCMYQMWQKDMDEGKPPRIIIPLVFYHGRKTWNIPLSFTNQFDVSDDIKEFLLEYRYILFDTRDWNFRDKINEELKDNIFLLTALGLMKSAFQKDFDTIKEIFRFWNENGFVDDREKVLLFLAYIVETKDISEEKLQEILEESKIDGGDIMPTLAQRLRKEGKLETAKNLLKMGMDIDKIAKATGLKKAELKKLAATSH